MKSVNLRIITSDMAALDTHMNMQGKIVLITGANSGLGFATASALAAQGASIIMVCRDPKRGAEARDKITALATAAVPVLLIADLSSQVSIRTLAAEIYKRFTHIDVLINNAGGVFAQREFSVDGIEKTFAINHLAPFLLTHLVLNLLKASPAGRIVNIASNLHNVSPDFFNNLQGEQKYNFMLAHKQSKLGLILFTYELARRLQGTNVVVNCVEPGPTKTRFGDNMDNIASLFLRIMKRLPIFRSPEEGALALIYAASSSEVEGVTGKYFVKSKPAKSKPITYDLDVAARHWAVSERLIGLASPKAFGRAPA